MRFLEVKENDRRGTSSATVNSVRDALVTDSTQSATDTCLYSP